MNKSLKERATIIQRRLIADDRGWFLKSNYRNRGGHTYSYW